ncbi:MAG: MmcQ/YjbR family DNA-binding protein [Bacteroidetes bacterium]|nr:MmcQ/YjbR family DNA-binding protein [Bacteroidota bacterium]
MNLESFREFCLKKPGAREEFPFGEETMVFKVAGKMFALTDVETFASINLKCDPEVAVELREQYPSVQPGYHMNKKHWNTVLMDGSIPDRLVREWIDGSYNLVAPRAKASKKKTPKKK